MPLESSAWTSKYGAPVGAEIAVSNPRLDGLTSGTIEPGVVPASTRHDDTVVAPFQLAHT